MITFAARLKWKLQTEIKKRSEIDYWKLGLSSENLGSWLLYLDSKI